MINYINSRLVSWSWYELKSADNGLGFPSECPYTRLMARSGGAGYHSDTNDNDQELGEIMAKLKRSEPLLFRATHLFYGVEYKNGKAISTMVTKEQIAKELKISRDTLYTWLHKSHVFILDALHEHDVIAHLR
jgi:hypothetical protein